MKKFSILVATLALAGGSAVAQAESVTMSFLNDDGSVGKSAGTVALEQTKEGLKFTPDLKGLPPGEHGQSIRADLAEEFRAHARDRSTWHARWWYRRQALSLSSQAKPPPPQGASQSVTPALKPM